MLTASAAADKYPSNTALYADPALAEGVDYARRFRRHEWFDDDLTQRYGVQRTAILAPHGGGIETGTSELCLAIAGYHPADLTPSNPVHDYWMFEGLRSSSNGELHVTSTNCDDHVARALAAGSLNAIGLHGCTTTQAGLADNTQAVLVGGRNNAFKSRLLTRLNAAGIRAIDAASIPDLNGDEPTNLANRTLLGAGAQLELTTPLRVAMFGTNTRADRKNTTKPVFWAFTNATRAAIADVEATEPIS
ncbi:poly-gamma-glutamate hydrolase family protein [Kribbella sp. NPDC051587]|uniref:poly-gamma-glutamate hydrolase family protein n=1 Tax=Kribbella sp. NPDC051587 TaxID=3364119 RepID=UPI0037B7B27B